MPKTTIARGNTRKKESVGYIERLKKELYDFFSYWDFLCNTSLFF